MTISDYQITSVIKTYVKNMKLRVKAVEDEIKQETREDSVVISEEGMKRMLYERIEGNVTEKLRKYEQDR